MISISLQERINKYIIKNSSDCWLWIGANNKGHGIISDKGKTHSVKKILYSSVHGSEDSGGYLHQVCDNKTCVNPNHLISRDRLFMTLFIRDGSTGCWEWTGAIKEGYGIFSVNHKDKLAHRLMYEKYKGKIPQGMNICHTCDNPKCVNPEHLWVGSQAENVADMMKKRRGLKSFGSNHHFSTITDEIAREIKTKLRDGMTIKQVHMILGASYRVVQHIHAETTWRHIVI